MPGTVRSRNGCLRCRTRKIKCDEAHPQCGRCKSVGFPCPGYRSPTEIVFRSMNKKVQNRVAWTQAAHERANEPSPQQVKEPIFNSEEAFRPCDSGKATHDRAPLIVSNHNLPPPLRYSLSTDWRDPALCRFFKDYVLDTNEVKVGPGYLNHLPELYGEATDEILTRAVSAVSLASFSNQVRSEALLDTARKSYGKALFLVKQALSNPKQIDKDGTLAGVFFLNMYEMISGDKPMLNQYGTHADALGLLLRLRSNSNQFTSERSGGIARGAHGVIVFKNLLRRVPPGPESVFWEQSIDPTQHWAKVGLATIRITRLIPIADALLLEETDVDPLGHRLLEAINSFEAEDRSFEAWRDTAEYPYSYGTVDRESLFAHRNLTGIPLPGVINYYEDIWIAGFWNVYRFARVVLLQTMAKLAAKVSLYPGLASMTARVDGLRDKAIKEVDVMVNDICASIPYILGKVDKDGWVPKIPDGSLSRKAITGYTSIWPLRLSLMVKTLSVNQKRYIFDQLEFIHGSMGIRQAKVNV